MARGRTTSLTISLTPAERQTLLAWQRSTTITAGLARRGRIVLLRADGMSACPEKVSSPSRCKSDRGQKTQAS